MNWHHLSVTFDLDRMRSDTINCNDIVVVQADRFGRDTTSTMRGGYRPCPASWSRWSSSRSAWWTIGRASAWTGPV